MLALKSAIYLLLSSYNSVNFHDDFDQRKIEGYNSIKISVDEVSELCKAL